MKTIFCTVGTSTIEKTRWETLPWQQDNNPVYMPLKDFDSNCWEYNKYRLEPRETARSGYVRLKRWMEQVASEVTGNYVTEATKTKWQHWNDDTWRIMPAEVGSTLRMIEYLEGREADLSNIQIILFVSDTAQAYTSACVIKDVFQAIGFASQNIELVTIERFQMEDIKKFTDEGLPNFIRELKKRIDENDKEHQLLNITGGYKNFIPLVTHIASFYGLDMYYVFEEAIIKGRESLVKIPRIPTLNRLLRTTEKQAGVLKEILVCLDKKGYRSRREVWRVIENMLQSIKPEEAEEDVIDQYEEFIRDFMEEREGGIGLSMIGRLYLELIRS
ncbi:hypothetical protein GLN3_14630 [Geobacillus lituanicus]|nr:hypothetical protein GLN3_14630 [Geobacillus lituanicus]